MQIWADVVTLLLYPLRHKMTIRTEWQRLQMAMRTIPCGESSEKSWQVGLMLEAAKGA